MFLLKSRRSLPVISIQEVVFAATTLENPYVIVRRTARRRADKCRVDIKREGSETVNVRFTGRDAWMAFLLHVLPISFSFSPEFRPQFIVREHIPRGSTADGAEETVLL